MAITGFVALVNEVAWTRVLSLIVGPTTYAFGAMLSVFIAGLAAGSAVAARFADRVRHPPLALALVMVAVAAAPAAVMSTVEPWSMRVARVVASAGAGFGDLLRIQALSAAALLLPLTFALGAAFPLALRVAVRARDAVSHDVAIVYAANTAGAIAGSLIGGFVLVPNFGLQRALLLTCIIALCGAVVLTMASRMPRRAAFGGMFAAIAGGSLIWAAPSWDMDLLASGAYKYAPYMQGADVASVLRAGTTLYFREGAAATVAVRRVAGTTTLSIEGKVDASNGGDMLTQKLLAHLPLLLHEHPRRVAIIGLGSGVTLGAALTHPIERADAIEISPEVVHASHFFDVENHRALADPRARLIVGDGRSHVMLTRERYDVIISEPSNPWMAGIAALFTREFFQAVRRSLQEDGIFCQWAHTYDISDADLRSIAATFISVYPDATMWLIGEADLLFVASPTGLTDRLNGIRAAFNRSGVAGDLREAAVLDPESILATFVAGPAELAAYSAGAVVQTDDRLALEFSAPRSIVGRRDPNNAAVIRGLATEHSLPQPVREARASSSSDAWRNRGQMLLQAEAYSTAYDAYTRALALAPVDESVLGGFVKAAAGARRDRDAERVLAAVVDNHPNDVAPRIQLSRLLASRGEIEHAINAIAPLMTSRPDDPRAFEQAASIFADVGDASRLREVVDHLQRAWPLKSSSRYYAAALALQDGRATDALRLAELAIAGESPEARAYNLKGAAAATLGQRDEARRAFEEALRRDPHDATAYVNLGLIELESGRTAAASRHFAEALIVDPDSRAAREGLAGVADRR